MRLFAFFGTVVYCFSVLGQLTWQRTYGAYSTEEGNSVVVLDDGYMVVGSTGSFGAGSGDIYVLKLTLEGERAWSRTLGGNGVDQGRQVKATSDGGFIVAGFTNSSGNGGYDGYLAKLNSDGWPIWERTFGGSDWDFFHSVIERPDGGFMAAGETFSNGSGDSDAWLVHVSDDGDLIWEDQYGGIEGDLARSIIHCSSGGYLFAGETTVGGDQDAWIVRVDDAGGTLWTSTQGGDSLDIVNSVVETIDGGFAAVGTTKSFNTVTEAYHFKVDVTGVLVWEWNWGQVNDQESFDVKELPDGRLLSTGYVTSGGSGGRDMFIFFTLSDGSFERGVSNGGDDGEGDEVGSGLALTPDGGSIHCGSTTSFGFGPKDAYVVKTNDTGWTATSAVVDVFDPVGVMDRQQVHAVSLFPNPASATCRLTTGDPLASATLFDPQGRLVRTWSAPIPQELDLRGLAEGTYQFVAIGDDGRRMALPLMIAGN